MAEHQHQLHLDALDDHIQAIYHNSQAIHHGFTKLISSCAENTLLLRKILDLLPDSTNPSQPHDEPQVFDEMLKTTSAATCVFGIGENDGSALVDDISDSVTLSLQSVVQSTESYVEHEAVASHETLPNKLRRGYPFIDCKYPALTRRFDTPGVISTAMNCFVSVLPYDLFDFGSLSLVVDVDDPYGFRLLVMGRSSHDVYVVSAKVGLLLDMYEQLADFPFMLQVFDHNLVCWPTNVFFQSKLFDPRISKHLLDANRLIDSRLSVYFVHNAADIVMKNAFEFNLYKAEKDKIYGIIVNQVDVYGIMGYMQQQSAEKEVEKNVFAAFYSVERAKSKILKICDALGANRYSFSEDLSKQFQMMTEVSGSLSEFNTTVEIGLTHRTNLLQTIGFQFQKWNLLVKKEKSIYHTLNMLNMDVTRKCLVTEGWCPVFATDQIQNALRQAALESSSQIGTIFQVLQTKDSPPTYFRTNKFTSPFQEIVDAYGIAKYQEANPGVHTIITFPFLFAVMFGDWGHGICLLAAALYLIAREKKLSSQKLGDIMEMTFGGRNVIMMMAIFSIYTGLLHNEFFLVPFELFGPSAYSCRDLSRRDASTAGIIKVRATYPFGVDPKWHCTRSALFFLNSLKMKMSILLGVTQMNLRIIISYCNAKFFRDELNIWYQFVPHIIFLNSLFGYLSILICVKWCTGSQADLYHVMIYMFLSPAVDLGDNQLFIGQKFLQILLLLAALVAVPWMLFPKPFLLK